MLDCACVLVQRVILNSYLILVGSVEDGVRDLALPGPVLGLEEGLGGELGGALGLLVLLQLGDEADLAGAVHVEDERRAVVAGGDEAGVRHPDHGEEGQVAGLQLEDGHALGGVGHRERGVVPNPGEAVSIRGERDGVDPAAALKLTRRRIYKDCSFFEKASSGQSENRPLTHIQAVGELSQELLEGHLAAPGRGGGLVLDVLDVAGEDADLEPGGASRDQTVVGVPVEGGDGALDRLLDVLGHPPIILGLRLKN